MGLRALERVAPQGFFLSADVFERRASGGDRLFQLFQLRCASVTAPPSCTRTARSDCGAPRAEGPPFRPRGPPFHRARVEGLGKRVRPVAVAAMAASAVMVKLDSAALEIAGAWLAKREDDVADGERVNAHSAQVAHAALLPRVRG